MKSYTTFDKPFWKSIIPFIFLVLFILFLPYLFTSRSWFGIDFSNTGEIGDTLGGIIGPFVAIVAAFLTYMAFWVQYKANVQLKQDIQVDRLETRIYEMLNLHSKNVGELELMGFIGRNEKIFSGRNVFPHLFNEYRRTYSEVVSVIKRFDDYDYLKNYITEISYLIFFIGIKNENFKYLSSMLKPYLHDDNIKLIVKHFDDLQESDYLGDMSDDPGYDFYKSYFNYPHFNGYNSQLGHYYRHLYQMVKYIAEYSEKIITPSQKYNYVKTIRAQLSDHEQLLLYYDSLSTFGEAWLENKYLVQYKMIKNIPLSIIDLGIKPEEKFADEIEEARKKGEEFFERR